MISLKGDLERELGRLVLDCTKCGQTVHYVPGIGVSAGHWAHREAAPHGEPVVQTHTFAELLIDLEDRTFGAVLVGPLREAERQELSS